MTAESQIHSELSEITKVAMEEKSGLNVSSHEDLPKVGGDCNGVNKPGGAVNNQNVGRKDDSDGSYVFMDRIESGNGDLIDRDLKADGVHKSQVVSEFKDIQGQVGKLNDAKGEIAHAEPNCIGEGIDVAPTVGKPIVAGGDVIVQAQLSTAIVESECVGLNGDARLEEQIEPDTASDLEQSQEFLTTVLEVDHSGTTPLNQGKIEYEEQIGLNSTAESGKVQKCQVLDLEVCDLHDGEEKTEKQNNLANSHLGESEGAQIGYSEPSDCKSSLLDDGKFNSEDHASVEGSTELEGSPESQVKVSEAAECQVPEVEVWLDDGKIESDKKTNLNSTAESGEESQILVSESHELYDGEEKPEIQNNLTKADFTESEEARIVDSEPSECKSLSNGNSNLNSEETTTIEVSTEVEGENRSEVMVSEAAECKSPVVEIGKVITKKQIELESAREVEESLEFETTKVESTELECHPLDDGNVKVEEEEKTDLVLDIKENQELLPLVTDDLNSGAEEVNKVTKLAIETVPLEAEIADEPVLDESNDSYPAPCVNGGITQAPVLNKLVDGCQNATDLSGSGGNTKSLIDPSDCQKSECETGSEPVGSVLCCPTEDAKVKTEFQHDTVEGNITRSFEEVKSGTEHDLSVNGEGNASTSSCAEINNQAEVSNSVIDCASIQPIAAKSLDPEYHANDELQNGSGAHMKSESQVENCPLVSVRDMPCSDGDISRSEIVDTCIVNSGSEPSFVPDASNVLDDGDQVNSGDGDNFDNFKCKKDEESSDVLKGQSAGMEGVKRPFNFLIKVPRFDNEKLREQIRHAQLQVVEKTHLRDAIRDDIQMTTENFHQLRDGREAARSEARGARGLVNLKRQEIDSVQFVINRVKNAISVEDMNVRINNMEHMIEHETLPLKEEKYLIRQIKQLKNLREELASNMGSQDELQQALDQRDRHEERLKILKKELDCLKDKVSKAQATSEAAEKKWNDEGKKLKELQAQFRAADDVRQKAYVHLQNLKRQLYEKNTQFRMYKDDTTAAYEYASNQDKEGLHRLCVNQVETIMDFWNKDDEFRNEYLRCNTRSTLRRFRTSDGRALGPHEEPTALPNFVDGRSLATPLKEKSELPNLILERETQASTIVGEKTDGKSTVKVAEQTDQTANTKKPRKPTLRNGVETVSGRDETEETSEEEHKQTQEEQELARKEEELRKEEAAAKLKEQQRLEEKAKAKEALERKKRNAKKAQIKAELRAQKEAEQKEKEREKKAKKKERKKASAAEGLDGRNEEETALPSESPLVATKDAETEESHATINKRPQKASQFTKQSKTKSIPPPLRNRGKRRMQQWIWIIFTALVILALFLLGNIGFYSNLGHNLRMRNYGF